MSSEVPAPKRRPAALAAASVAKGTESSSGWIPSSPTSDQASSPSIRVLAPPWSPEVLQRDQTCHVHVASLLSAYWAAVLLQPAKGGRQLSGLKAVSESGVRYRTQVTGSAARSALVSFDMFLPDRARQTVSS